MLMRAICKMDGRTAIIESDYQTKKEFRKELNQNGYTVVGRVEIIEEGYQMTKKEKLYFNDGIR